ncbi:tetratricopeptide repeat protein [Rhodoferax sp.]|uniref:tetratricopeptide repeat protein n=1 Tax=Rhodoferax sp. TaxID=50421 RepID=UPI0025E49F3B|nr:tetratricopeptide repeat protein [Rhodoferax sp.]
MRSMLICLLFGCASAFAADTPTEPEPSAAQRMEAGRNAIEAKKWSVAITEFKAAVKEEPRNADAHNLLAYSFRKQAKPDLAKAFEHYRTALKLNPDHKGAHEYIGEAYLMDKKPAEAEKHLADLERICGNKTCEEYVDLAGAIAQYKLQQ